jgi:arylsulfatase A-like enzyme
MTGVHQQSLGTMHMRTRGMAGLRGGGPIEYDAVPPPQVKAFPELLRAAGYYTVNVGKHDYQFGTPFTMWDDSGPKADWRRRPADRPFLVFINLHHTHESYLWPEETSSDNPLVRAVAERNKREFLGKARRTDPAAVLVPPYLPDTPVVRADLARLYDNLSFDDQNVQAIMDALRADGVLDNTIVVVTSDHGDGLPRVKRAVHASGLNVPFLVRYPDRRGAGTDATRLVSLVDLAPTVLNWAGVRVPRWIQGSSLAQRRRVPYVFGATDRFDELPERRKTAIDGRFQYIRSYGSEVFLRPLRFRDQLPTMQELWRLKAAGALSAAQAQLFRELPREQLFDLRSDPHTMRNLAAEPAHTADLRRLRAAMDGWLARTADFSAVPERQMIERMWPGMVQPVTAAPVFKVRTGRAGSSVVLSAPTIGASIGYSLEGPNAERWRLYTGPVPLAPGRRLWAKAIRYGYSESPVVEVAAPL